ncbi:MAG: MFS transporter [Actinobacteria bacterium]|jgi:MFS family permease|nr:MAG: MFS transporter [Actinomycetota bacterium]
MEGKTAIDDRLFRRDFVTVCTSNFLAYFSIYLVIPILPVFLEERGYSNALIGALMAMATVAALLRPLFGRAADLRGRKLVLVLGTLMLGASTFLYAAFSSALPLFFIRFLNGLGLAAFHTAAYAVIGDLAPSTRRLQAIAIFYMSVDLTIAVAPIVAIAMEEAWGFTPVYILAGCLAVLAMFVSLAVRETRSHVEHVDAGERRRIKVTPLQKAIFVNTMGFTLTFGTLQTFIILSSEAKGMDLGQYFFTIFAVTLIVFRLGVGRKADRWPRRPLIITSAVAALVGLITIAFAGGIALLFTGIFIYALGFAYLPTTLSALLLDHTKPSDRGAALGIFMAVFDVGIGLGSIALGPLADLWSYTTMYLVSGAIGATGLLYFLLRTTGTGAAGSE